MFSCIFLVKDKITKLSVRNFGGHPVKIFASTTMGYVHRESKHILGLFSKNNGETLVKHNSAKICQDKSPGQAKHDATKGAFQTNSRQKPECDYICSEVEISGAQSNNLVNEQSHENSYIERLISTFAECALLC